MPVHCTLSKMWVTLVVQCGVSTNVTRGRGTIGAYMNLGSLACCRPIAIVFNFLGLQAFNVEGGGGEEVCYTMAQSFDGYATVILLYISSIYWKGFEPESDLSFYDETRVGLKSELESSVKALGLLVKKTKTKRNKDTTNRLSAYASNSHELCVTFSCFILLTFYWLLRRCPHVLGSCYQ